MELGHGERVDVLVVLAAEGRRLLDVVVADTGGDLAAARLAVAGIDAGRAAAVLAGAGEAAPGEATVVGELAGGQFAKVEASGLLGRALVLAVLGVEREEVLFC